MTRPRAADDFPAIRARMEELRQARASASTGDDEHQQNLRPYAGGARPRLGEGTGLSPFMRRALLKAR